MLQEVNIENLQGDYLDSGGYNYVYYYQGQRFTGIAVEYYDDGITPMVKEEYHNGYQNGWVRYYHENGQLHNELKKLDTLIIAGTYKEYDENGNLLLEG